MRRSAFTYHTALNVRPAAQEDRAKGDGLWAVYQDEWTEYSGDIIERSSSLYAGPFETLSDAETVRLENMGR